MTGHDDRPVAILVEGERERDAWLVHRLRAIERHTAARDHRVYVWADDEPDQRLRRAIGPRGKLVAPDQSAVPTTSVPLQELVAAAARDGVGRVVALGRDVVPISQEWLAKVIGPVDSGASIVGLRDDREPDAVGFLCASTDALKSLGCLDTAIDAADVVAAARASGASIHDLEPTDGAPARSAMPGGIFGDVVYHHDTASARRAGAGDGLRGQQLTRLYDDMICRHEEQYLAWRRGSTTEGSVVFVLGMHRSGTSLLTACLERCGLFLGEVVRQTLIDQPRGSFERLGVAAINDAILSTAGGDWRNPPAHPVTVDPHGASAIATTLSELEARAPAGLKDPRTLLTIESWMAAANRPTLIGTFRHPSEVARSLWDRDRMPAAQAYELWNSYNERLVDMHRRYDFPLIEFDLTDTAAYARRIVGAAAELGLRPSVGAVLEVIETRGASGEASLDRLVPERCRSTYAYLREHRYDGVADAESFAAALCAWATVGAEKSDRGSGRRLEIRLWDLGRRLPGPVRRGAWRIRNLVRSSLRESGAQEDERR